ncbi:hypothetical protein NADFUDRAFT_78337 [Nadsonia fulvescens var. elongata DSM 6958]|uniref:RNA-binding protein VTS1 n=1 Tax=Nadsonia fulvescens var. elongata DSM 6958 TaxID=857566 RepID=A0A1E3PJI8_9ASCO|nr:hypothetical protein NADFUDRAFT_78337 [Nadsonia fulvescens var. elongata DSM 6958]
MSAAPLSKQDSTSYEFGDSPFCFPDRSRYFEMPENNQSRSTDNQLSNAGAGFTNVASMATTTPLFSTAADEASRSLTPHVAMDSFSDNKFQASKASFAQGHYLHSSADVSVSPATTASTRRPISDIFSHHSRSKNASSENHLDEAANKWMADLERDQTMLEQMAIVSLDANFKNELSAIENWFSALNAGERTATLYALLQKTSQVQVHFFIAVLQKMAHSNPAAALATTTAATISTSATLASSSAALSPPFAEKRDDISQRLNKMKSQNFAEALATNSDGTAFNRHPGHGDPAYRIESPHPISPIVGDPNSFNASGFTSPVYQRLSGLPIHSPNSNLDIYPSSYNGAFSNFSPISSPKVRSTFMPHPASTLEDHHVDTGFPSTPHPLYNNGNNNINSNNTNNVNSNNGINSNIRVSTPVASIDSIFNNFTGSLAALSINSRDREISRPKSADISSTSTSLYNHPLVPGHMRFSSPLAINSNATSYDDADRLFTNKMNNTFNQINNPQLSFVNYSNCASNQTPAHTLELRQPQPMTPSALHNVTVGASLTPSRQLTSPMHLKNLILNGFNESSLSSWGNSSHEMNNLANAKSNNLSLSSDNRVTTPSINITAPAGQPRDSPLPSLNGLTIATNNSKKTNTDRGFKTHKRKSVSLSASDFRSPASPIHFDSTQFAIGMGPNQSNSRNLGPNDEFTANYQQLQLQQQLRPSNRSLVNHTSSGGLIMPSSPTNTLDNSALQTDSIFTGSSATDVGVPIPNHEFEDFNYSSVPDRRCTYTTAGIDKTSRCGPLSMGSRSHNSTPVNVPVNTSVHGNVISNFASSAPRKNKENVYDAELLGDIGAWLRNLRLHKYTDNLKDLTWMELIQLDDKALEERGVNALGARRKMLKVFDEVKEASEAGLI